MLGKIFQKKKRESEKNTALNAMNLLVGILVRYPEIGTVRFDPASQCLQFSYTLEAGMLDVLPQSQINFQQDIMEGIKGYHLLNKIYSSVVEVEVEVAEEEVEEVGEEQVKEDEEEREEGGV